MNGANRGQDNSAAHDPSRHDLGFLLPVSYRAALIQ
jgi:hypothetical protein